MQQRHQKLREDKKLQAWESLLILAMVVVLSPSLNFHVRPISKKHSKNFPSQSPTAETSRKRR